MNSYGFDGEIPEDAAYGVYDCENGEWTGVFFSSKEDAVDAGQKVAYDGPLYIVSVEREDWL